jgi:hypothetical protein
MWNDKKIRENIFMFLRWLSSGIFEKHKLLFSFQITIKLEQDMSHVKQEELDFFIKVGGAFTLSSYVIDTNDTQG